MPPFYLYCIATETSGDDLYLQSGHTAKQVKREERGMNFLLSKVFFVFFSTCVCVCLNFASFSLFKGLRGSGEGGGAEGERR